MERGEGKREGKRWKGGEGEGGRIEGEREIDIERVNDLAKTFFFSSSSNKQEIRWTIDKEK